MHDAHNIEIWRHWRKGVKPPISRLKADNIFFQCLTAKDKKYYPIAIISWLHLRINYWPYKIAKAIFDGILSGIKEAVLFTKFMVGKNGR